jgi:hypothetical protein
MQPENGGSKLDSSEDGVGPVVVSGGNAAARLEGSAAVGTQGSGCIPRAASYTRGTGQFVLGGRPACTAAHARRSRLCAGASEAVAARKACLRVCSAGNTTTAPARSARRQVKARRVTQRSAGGGYCGRQSAWAAPAARCGPGPPFAPAAC